mmetsp:Transcript_34664/g.99594  ORF Transcript_34664/g.99594 Transcript_34664/m.99594 type:complete len:299 (-) Transcript_34664:253-1149(-)
MEFSIPPRKRCRPMLATWSGASARAVDEWRVGVSGAGYSERLAPSGRDPDLGQVACREQQADGGDQAPRHACGSSACPTVMPSCTAVTTAMNCDAPPQVCPNREQAALESLWKTMECCVCLDTIAHAHSLPCGHSFCGPCAFRSLLVRPRCPECRRHAQPSALRAQLRIDSQVEGILELMELRRFRCSAASSEVPPNLEEWRARRTWNAAALERLRAEQDPDHGGAGPSDGSLLSNGHPAFSHADSMPSLLGVSPAMSTPTSLPSPAASFAERTPTSPAYSPASPSSPVHSADEDFPA